MENQRTITFNGVEYKVRGIRIPSSAYVEISTLSLEHVLMDDDGLFVSEEAQAIDESLFFYVEDDQIDLPEAELEQILEAVLYPYD